MAPGPPAMRSEAPDGAPPAPSPTGSLGTDLRTLGRGLIAYGIVGVALALVGLALATVLLGRLNGVGDRITPQLATLSETIDSTIAALDQASATSRTFAATLATTGPALDSVASSISTVQPTLAAAGASLSGIDVLGRRPFEQVGSLLTRVSTELASLGPQLGTVSAGLRDNGAALASTAASLDALGESLQKAKATLASGVIEQSISDVIWTFLVSMVLIVVFFAVPAAAALVLGVWLLRRVVPGIGGPGTVIADG